MIERYKMYAGYSHMYMEPDGDFVRYEDHRALLDKANAAIKEAYQNGKKEGARQAMSKTGVQDWQTGWEAPKNPFVERKG
jgi:hypothetical protein